MGMMGENPLLFELLNEMDVLAEDADVIFALTTNCPDLLEPALAARPGRIDQAVEIPLPDADCRRWLLDLYGEGLDLHLEDPRPIIDRTEGVSASFIKELLRRATLFAAEDGGELIVTDQHLVGALDEILNGLSESWMEAQPTARLRNLAEQALAFHSLRAADALQLAAAQIWCNSQPQGRPFVCLDERLRNAAARSGFTLLPDSADRQHCF